MISSTPAPHWHNIRFSWDDVYEMAGCAGHSEPPLVCRDIIEFTNYVQGMKRAEAQAFADIAFDFFIAIAHIHACHKQGITRTEGH